MPNGDQNDLVELLFMLWVFSRLATLLASF